ncbi:hypothetical protein SAMN04487928_11038 [Butyrivibrio proteoclasticus]|uniref:Uncharacterized protein n=1 Tax=Butyrivibrio proteoclasticus TaxID=43305 RepID=A0A1I5TX04_9FIRM|nr:hypothetical protein [Butyrivibrio proteoclasticus]SFP86846.1 hypothetical protein SAMN04487928_11038 [Butyrivibrio proteoclasticus]
MSEYFCKYCREEDEDTMEDMIFEEVLNFEVWGDLKVDVHVYSDTKSMVLDINRVNTVVGIRV